MELVEDGPSMDMDLVVRRHHLPNDGLRKEATMKLSIERPKKKVKNVKHDVIKGKIGKIYMPDQQVGKMKLSQNAKGMKRECREGKKKKENGDHEMKKPKLDTE